MQSDLTGLQLLVVVHAGREDPPKVRVEVQRTGVGSRRTLGPFLGERTKNLYEELDTPGKHLLTVIRLVAAGPPFQIPDRLLQDGAFVRALRATHRVYVQRGRFGSLRRLEGDALDKVLPLPAERRNYPAGFLVRGELYIHGTSHLTMEVRLRYNSVFESVPPEDSVLALPTLDGNYVHRDAGAEADLLRDLEPHIRYPNHSFHISASDVGSIEQLDPQRWALFTAKRKPIQRMTRASKPSGITWFGSPERESSSSPSSTAIFLAAYLKGRAFVEYKGNTVLISPSWVVHNSNQLFQSLSNARVNYSRLAEADLDVKASAELRQQLSDQLSAAGFQGKLRGYQLDGLNWIRQLRARKLGGLLADEMGLGKTVQVLAHLALLDSQQACFLIVTPASVVPNWIAEIARFLPRLAQKIVNAPEDLRRTSPIAVLSYQMVLRHHKTFRTHEFDTVVLDEGQMVKNEQTQTAVAVRTLKTTHRLVLTGTPIENNVDELWTHASFLNPELGAIHDAVTHAIPEFSRSVRAAHISGAFLRPIVLRRVKEEVAKDLPPRLEKMIVCALSSEERTLYDRVLTTFSDSIRTGVAARVPSIALEALLRLRQCCALPQMLPNPFCPDISCPTSKLDLAEGLLLDACASNRKSLFFSQFTAVLDTLEKRLRRLKIGVVRLDGSTMDRAAPVQLFQNDEQIKVFLIAFRAGGFGLNLTAAERVILYDPWWNAAAEEQAFARAHRIGQRRGVLIQRLVCSDTVEQKMVELRDKKEELARTAMEVNTGFGLEEMKALIGIS